MPRPGGTVPITWVRANLGALIRWTAHTRERTIITDHGRPAAVLVSAEELAYLEDALAQHQSCEQPNRAAEQRAAASRAPATAWQVSDTPSPAS